MSEDRSNVAARVAAIWQEVLSVPQISSTDNFLDLGGNSLRAGEIVWRIRQDLGVEVPIDTVLADETFEEFVQSIEAAVVVSDVG